MLASFLKEIADKNNKEAEDPQINETLRLLEHELSILAKQGKYSCSMPLSRINVSKKVWEHVTNKLRKNGFKIEFDTEITAWYSNTDWDQEDIVKISWL